MRLHGALHVGPHGGGRDAHRQLQEDDDDEAASELGG